MPFDRDLQEIHNAQLDATLEGIRKVEVGFVTAVKPDGTVDVQLAQNRPLFAADGTTVFEPAIVVNAIWCTLRAGGFLVWLPPAVGNSVLVLYSDLSVDAWRASNGKAPTNPGWVGRHGADSPFAMPMIAPDSQPLQSADPNKLVIGKDGDPARIIIGSDIELGGAVTGFVALANLVANELTAIATAFTNLVAPSGGGPVTPAVPAKAYTTPGNVAATLVKAQ